MTSGTTARGAVVGVVVAGGAAAAHALAGGVVRPGDAVLALAVSVGAALVVLRPGRVDVVRLALVALGVQALWHLHFAGAIPGALQGGAVPAHGHAVEPAGQPDGVAMLGAHLLVAALTVALAAGADRALLDLARAFVERLLPRRPGAPAVAPRAGVPLGWWQRPVTAAPRTIAARGPPGSPPVPFAAAPRH